MANRKKKSRPRNRPSQRPAQGGTSGSSAPVAQADRTAEEPTPKPERKSQPPAKKASSAQQRTAARRAARRRKQIIYWSVIGVVAVALLVFVFVTKQGSSGKPAPVGTATANPAQAASTPLHIGDTLPTFSAKGLPQTAYANKTVTQDLISGKRALVSVWAPWCPHCQKELPLLGKLLPSYQGSTVLTVETGAGVKPGPTPEKLVTDSKLTQVPTAWDDSNSSGAFTGTLATAFGVDAFPVLYVVDDTGKIVSVWQGETSQSWLQQALNYTKGVGSPPPSVPESQLQ
jgi:thiol-disulfide isomerase/thioredoxin